MTHHETASGPTLTAARELWAIIDANLTSVRRIAVGVPVLWLVVRLLVGPTYSATSAFMPEQGGASGGGQLAGLAAQIGLPLNFGGQIGDPVVFYSELLRGREMWRQAATTPLWYARNETGADSLQGTMVDMLALKGQGPFEMIRRVADRRRRHVLASTYHEASLVRLTTTARWPSLAVQLNRQLLSQVDSFNLQRRRRRASQEREFIEGRMSAAQAELRTAEDDLRRFLDRNRQFAAPDLRFENDRLMRAVQLRQSIYLQLATAYDQARIEEVRSAPVVTLVDPPERGVRRNGSMLVDGTIWLLVGIVLGVAYALAWHAAEAVVGTQASLRALLRALVSRSA